MIALTLGLVNCAVWLLLSGHVSDVLLLSLGLLSSALVVWLAHRMELLHQDRLSLALVGRGLGYAPWLVLEIGKANVDVIRRIVNPRLPISPLLFKVPTSQQSDLGRVVYANSITLTPGTVSVQVEGDHIMVHALSREAAEGLLQGEMDRRVSQVEGRR